MGENFPFLKLLYVPFPSNFPSRNIPNFFVVCSFVVTITHVTHIIRQSTPKSLLSGPSPQRHRFLMSRIMRIVFLS